MRSVRRLGAAVVQRLVRPSERTRSVQVRGLRVVVEPGVFDPVLFRSGVLLADAVAARVQPGERVLEVGPGSGVGAIVAARHGATVLAVDANPAAVACTRRNADRLGVGERVQVRQGDVYRGVDGPFDRVISNPPFYVGPPAHDPDRAWRGEGVLERLRAAPKGTKSTSAMLNRAADGLVAGGRSGIFTPLAFFVARVV